VPDPSQRYPTETAIRTRNVTLEISNAGWPLGQMREEFRHSSAGRIPVNRKTATHKQATMVDYLLAYRADLPVAIVEAKHNRQHASTGMLVYGAAR
jgi:type I restriction enzyme R subunit